MTTHW